MTGRIEAEQATLVTDEEVPARLAQIIRQAEMNIVLISPYVNDWKRLYNWLPPAVAEGGYVVLVVRA